MDENTINDAFVTITAARMNVLAGSEEVARQRRDLKAREHWAVMAGDIVIGKNETERKAQLTEACKVEILKLEEAEKRYAIIQAEYDCASYEVSRVKLLVAFLGLSGQNFYPVLESK